MFHEMFVLFSACLLFFFVEENYRIFPGVSTHGLKFSEMGGGENAWACSFLKHALSILLPRANCSWLYKPVIFWIRNKNKMVLETDLDSNLFILLNLHFYRKPSFSRCTLKFTHLTQGVILNVEWISSLAIDLLTWLSFFHRLRTGESSLDQISLSNLQPAVTDLLKIRSCEITWEIKR